MLEIDYYLLKRPLTGLDNECGDTGIIKTYGNKCFLALIDVLGHGREAYDVSVLAEKYLLENYRRDLIDIMNGLHSHLKGTRGAVVALCRLNLINGGMNYVGVGNITTRIFGSEFLTLIPRDGIVGYTIAAPKEHQVTVCPGDILILYSDGVKEHFDLAHHNYLLNGTARK
ncbi:MAG: SpoIIE family protein phosphatase, partial [Deltaproteobacteria bacterium]|nr:SpoIIE family protein phosphatase [Deltaproteobacteria bacterium]